MPHRTVYFDLTETADDRFDRPIEAMLSLLLLFAPLASGAVQAWSEFVVILLATAMVLVLGIKLIRRPEVPFVWSWTYVPIAVFLMLGVAQVVPLPADTVKVISPYTFELKASLLQMANVTPSRMSLSFYPEATFQNLRMLVAISAVYVVALNVIRRGEQVRRIMGVIAGVGTLVAVIAMIHLGFRTSYIYGIFGEPISQWTTGPFVSRNHFGQFMNLSLGAAGGLLLVGMDDLNRSRRRGTAPGNLMTSLWVLGGMVVLISLGVFLSLSRGAILSLAVSAGVAAIVAWRRGLSSRLWALLPLVWLVSLVVIYFGFDLLARRFVQAIDPQSGAVGARLTIVQDALKAAKDTPILGHGLGSFETVYPMLDSSNSATLATHAENEYVQSLFEGGLVGLVTVVVFLMMIVRGYFQSLRSARSPMAMPAVGLGAGILAVALHSLSDFGQHLPANALVTAVEIAMLLNLATAAGRTGAEAPAVRRARPGIRAAGLVAAIIALGLVIADGWSVARAEWNWFDARAIHRTLRDRDWVGENDEFAQLLTASAAASAERPGDVSYRYWLNFYRFRSISRERDSAGRVLYDAQLLEWAKQIAGELRGGVRLCPTYGPNFSLAGQIERNVLELADGEKLIRKGFELSRIDPAATFEVGLLDAQEGNWANAMQKFERSATLVDAYRAEGALALASMKRADLAIELARGDVRVVERVVDALRRSGETESAAMAGKHLSELIRARAMDPNASARDLVDGANQALADNEPAVAVEYLQRALLIDPTRPEWRLQLARTLASTGDVQRAIKEAQAAQRNNATGAQQLIAELRTRPIARATSTPASTTRSGD